MRDTSTRAMLPMGAMDQLTWAVLLGRWVEFARSAVALPTVGEEGRLRESVPDAIMLQAVWFALGHLDGLSASQRALGLDRATVLIDRHEAALLARWDPQPLPPALRELVDDARAALGKAGGDIMSP